MSGATDLDYSITGMILGDVLTLLARFTTKQTYILLHNSGILGYTDSNVPVQPSPLTFYA